MATYLAAPFYTYPRSVTPLALCDAHISHLAHTLETKRAACIQYTIACVRALYNLPAGVSLLLRRCATWSSAHYRYITGYITVTLQVRDLEQRTALHVALDFEGDRHGVDLEVAEMLLAKGAEQVTSLWSRPCVARCLVRGASHTREAPL